VALSRVVDEYGYAIGAVCSFDSEKHLCDLRALRDLPSETEAYAIWKGWADTSGDSLAPFVVSYSLLQPGQLYFGGLVTSP